MFGTRPGRKRLSAAFLFSILLLAFAGCDSTDVSVDLHSYEEIPDGSLQICNLDNREYMVEIRLRADDQTLEIFDLGEWYDTAESCVQSEIPEPATCYILITDKASGETDRSKIFYMDTDIQRFFTIDTTGSITTSADDTGNILVCNRNDVAYQVTLSDGSTDNGVMELDLKAVSDPDAECREFNRVLEGKYYIVIRSRTDGAQNKSGLFFLDGGAFETFFIGADNEITRQAL